MKNFKILVRKGFHQSINIDLIAHGFYNKNIPTLYDENTDIDELKKKIISYQKQISNPDFFKTIEKNLYQNLNELCLKFVELHQENEYLDFEVFEIINKFIIPNYGEAPLNRKLIISNKKVYLNHVSLENEEQWVYLPFLNYEFLKNNKSIFKPI